MNDGLRDLAEQLALDYLLIDTHPGLNEETLLSIAISDVLVVLLRPDRQDFQGTAVTVEVARKLDVRELLLVLNKVLPTVAAGGFVDEVKRTYNAPIVGVLPEAPEMLELGSSGLFMLRSPDHPLSRELRRVATRTRVIPAAEATVLLMGAIALFGPCRQSLRCRNARR